MGEKETVSPIGKKWTVPSKTWGALALAVVSPLLCAAGPARAGKKAAHAAVKTTGAHHAALHTASATGKAHGHEVSARAGRGSRERLVLARAAGGHAAVGHVTAESQRLSAAFIASAQLRPMAQQLASLRSAAAYNGVLSYAASHPGEAGAAADLALGHAYSLAHHYPEAESSFRQASQQGQALGDYADYLGAQAALAANRPADATLLLPNFAERHPGSLFVPDVPVLQANAYLAAGDAGSAIRTLQPLANTPAGSHVDFRMTLAKAYAAAGQTDAASRLYRSVYLGDPLSNEAASAKAQLSALNVPLTPGERKQHADAMFNAKHYEIAASEYRALEKDERSLSQADRDALQIYAAVCDLRLKRLSRGDVEHLPVTNDDTAALKMYLQSELARSEGKSDEHDEMVQALLQRFPQSRWLEEALFSGGNMYLIKRDAPRAIEEYTELSQHFPNSLYSPASHWHAAWLSYRQRRFPEAAKLMDEQITSFPASPDVPGALYWRGRLYEDVERNFGQATNYYRALNAAYCNSYYAMLGRQRLAVLGNRDGEPPAAALASVRPVNDPHLTDALPENDPHLIKARLLANAALNEYIRPELALSETSAQWGALAEAEIYQSFGENTRAIQSMKRSKIPFFSLPVSGVPNVYWQLIFPRPYWDAITADAQANGLDPYLVASLIRQESEFNPGAVSRANAYGLMQLLPSTGKSIAKKEGDKHFTTAELLQTAPNIQLGTRDLRQTIDRFGGEVQYALASYNAGDTPVRQWMAAGDYKDIPEWVESIPYTETRDYVQAILRNREMYRAIYGGR